MTHSEDFLLGGRSHRQSMEKLGYFQIAGWIRLTEVRDASQKKKTSLNGTAYILP